MRIFAATLALLLTTASAGATLDTGLRRVAETPRSSTGGAVLAPFQPDVCVEASLDTHCAEQASLAAFVRRDAEVARLSAGWSGPARRAIADLRRAQRGFASAIARNEVDRRGVDRDDQAQAAAEAQCEAFVSLLRRTTDDTGRSIAIDVTPAKADTALTETYSLVMAEPIGYGSVTRDGVRETQRAWQAYRDAFVTLAKALGRPTDVLEAELAVARSRDLEGLIAD